MVRRILWLIGPSIVVLGVAALVLWAYDGFDNLGPSGAPEDPCPEHHPGAVMRDVSEHTTRLTVCEYVDSEGAVVESCEYTGGYTGLLVDASYTYLVFDTGTGQQVAEFTLAGTGSCPPMAWVTEGESDGRVTRTVSDTDLMNALRPFIPAG